MNAAFSTALAGLDPIRRGRGNQARCPAHPDNVRSLSIDEAADGKTLVKCHAGCDTRDIVAAMGLSMTDLFDEEPQTTTLPERREVAYYDYRAEDGTLLFQVVRFEPKGFTQRRPLPDGRWAYDLEGVDRVPYRLNEIVVSDDIIIVEGEKDADRLVAEGFAATTSPSGANNWRPEYARHFAGKSVIVIPDNDKAGQQYLQTIVDSLTGIAAKVRLVALPGLTRKGGDVSDWFDMGHTADELRRLIRPSIAPLLEEYVAAAPRETTDLYQDVIPSESLVVFVGQPRSFKTMAALQLMFSVASGQRWLGRDPLLTGSALYVSEEGSRAKVAERLVAMQNAFQPTDPIHILHREGITLGAASWDRVRDTLDEMERPRLVVLDTLAALMVGDENSVADIREALRPIQRIITDYRVTVALIHHINKGGEGRMGNRMRGSSALWGACDGTLGFMRDEDGGIALNTGEVRVETKDNDPIRIRFGFRPATMTLGHEERPVCTPAAIVAEVATRQAETNGAVKIEEVRDYFEAGRSWFYERVREAEDIGLVRTAKGYYKVTEGMFQ